VENIGIFRDRFVEIILIFVLKHALVMNINCEKRTGNKFCKGFSNTLKCMIQFSTNLMVMYIVATLME